MSGTIRSPNPALRTLARAVAGARDPQVRKIVATIDALIERGPADALIQPLRDRLAAMRPPRPLRFTRLLFHPLEPLIVPATRWRPGGGTIPRTALAPISHHVRLAMGKDARPIEAAIARRTTADTSTIRDQGRYLWPIAAETLDPLTPPAEWDSTGLGIAAYRDLSHEIGALLSQAVALDRLCTRSAGGMMPPDTEIIAGMLDDVQRACPEAASMLITLLLDALPASAAVIAQHTLGSRGNVWQTALEQAGDRLINQLDQWEGTETRLAAGSLADAGAAAAKIAAMIAQLDTAEAKPDRRRQLQAVRRRLDDACKARFICGLQNDLLVMLQHLNAAPTPATIAGIEETARGLRILEQESRSAGSGSAYDLLLDKAAEAVNSPSMRDVLSQADQVRLTEILIGSEAGLALLSKSHQQPDRA